MSSLARSIIQEADVVVSTASLWEIEIKRALGRIDVGVDELVREVARTIGFELLDVRPTHVLSLANLPPLHGDPFDRMLVAQALREHLTLVSRDSDVRRYDVDVRW